MKSSLSHTCTNPLRLASMICAALFVSSCGHFPHGKQEASALAPVTHPAPHLAQLNFGRQAEFGLCTPPACPTVTSKTLAPPHPHPAAAESRPPDPVSTLDTGEEIVSPSSRTVAGGPAPSRMTTRPFTKAVTVHFKFDDAVLSAADQVALDSAVAAAPNVQRIVISGGTDGIGTAGANERLATLRARAVQEHLLTFNPGLAPRLELDAHGACCYVARNDTEQGRSPNRRVEILFIGDGKPQP